MFGYTKYVFVSLNIGANFLVDTKLIKLVSILLIGLEQVIY